MAADVSDLVSFDEFITHWAADRPSRVAMREEDRLFTYAELEERTARVASALRAAGLEKGDRIAWIGKNSDLYFTLFFGAARAGIVMAPIGWRLSPVEWAYIINDTRAKIVFTGPGFDAAAASNGDRLGLLGMRERVESLGGEFQILSDKTGTRISAALPIEPNGDADE